jgi:peptidoglycan L-alanyl-D-glutamate endopeptidase CwlK
MDAVSESRLAEVHPELARRVRLLNDKCVANGVGLRVTQGLRTWTEQAALYAQGRTAPGAIVTHAQPGYTAHNFGYAVDVVPDKADMPVFVPDWNTMDLSWKWVLMLAEQCELAEGAEWRTYVDYPHIYLRELPATPDEEFRYTLSEGGMQAVFALIDKRLAGTRAQLPAVTET